MPDTVTMAAPIVAIIEDDVVTAQLYRTELQKAGFEVITMGDGLSGLHLLDRIAPNVVILDLMMTSMSGLEFLQRLHARKLPYNPKIVILSSVEDPESEEKIKHEGIDMFLIKSLTTPRQMIEDVKQLLPPPPPPEEAQASPDSAAPAAPPPGNSTPPQTAPTPEAPPTPPAETATPPAPAPPPSTEKPGPGSPSV